MESLTVKYRKGLAASACLVLAACAWRHPAPSAPAPTAPLVTAPVARQMSTYDNNTEFSVEHVQDGFNILVDYRFTGYILRSGTAQSECAIVLANVARSIAQRRERDIEPVAQQRIRFVTSRSWSGKVATCSASTKVEWKR
jgi:hypothetical protein